MAAKEARPSDWPGGGCDVVEEAGRRRTCPPESLSGEHGQPSRPSRTNTRRDGRKGRAREAEVRHLLGGRGIVGERPEASSSSPRLEAGRQVRRKVGDTRSDHGIPLGKSLPNLRRNSGFKTPPKIEGNALCPRWSSGLFELGCFRHLPAEEPRRDQNVRPSDPHADGRPGLCGGQHRLRCGLYHDPGLRLEASVKII